MEDTEVADASREFYFHRFAASIFYRWIIKARENESLCYKNRSQPFHAFLLRWCCWCFFFSFVGFRFGGVRQAQTHEKNAIFNWNNFFSFFFNFITVCDVRCYDFLIGSNGLPLGARWHEHWLLTTHVKQSNEHYAFGYCVTAAV